MSKKGDKETGRQGDKGKRKYLALENMSDPVSGRLTLKGTVLEAEAGAEWVKHAVAMGWMREGEGEGVQQRIEKVTETEYNNGLGK